VACHDAADFSLEVLGVALPFSVALGLLARDRRPLRVRPRLAATAACAAAGLAVGAVVVSRLHGESATRAPALAADADGAAEAARAAAPWHPADYVLYGQAGARFVDEGRCAEGVRWLSASMLLNPTAPEPHLYVARCLAASRQDALAKREYRLAIAYGAAEAMVDVVRRYRTVEEAYAAVPDAPEHLLSLARALGPERPEDAAAVLERVLAEYGDERAVVLLARARLALGDAAGAAELAERRSARAPAEPDGYELDAYALIQLGDEEGAAATLRRGLSRIPGSASILGILVERTLAQGRFSDARRLAEEIAPRSAGEAARKYQLVAHALAAQGRLGEAIESARAAVGAMPDAEGPLREVAQLCAAATRFDDAIAALELAAAIPGADRAAYAVDILALRARAAEQQQAAASGATRSRGADVQ